MKWIYRIIDSVNLYIAKLLKNPAKEFDFALRNFPYKQPSC